MRGKSWLEKNPNVAILFFIGCTILALSRTTIEANLQSSNMIQAANRAKSEKEKQMEISEALLTKQEAIAKRRFKNGCIMVVAMKAPDKFTSLTEGSPVIDRVRKTPLGANNVVCDRNGGTSVLIHNQEGESVVGEIFYTGDSALIKIASKNANARYALPNQ
ncbi:MAG: hypothetical protein KME54_25240 [Tolypothrix brevis GSE-NOS-MK-07-07A]|jgi:hypothetical protein|nr:hypothetical protein [Tolypothrix brevis GSE-NOS-MK-07-07A]